MPERLRMWMPIISIILFATTLVSSTIAGMQTSRVNEIREEIRMLRVDIKANDRDDDLLEQRVTILETSLKSDTAYIRETMGRLETTLEKVCK